MSNRFVTLQWRRAFERSLIPSTIGVLIVFFGLLPAWSQSAPDIRITGSAELNPVINTSTSPGTTKFNSLLLTVYCDANTGKMISLLRTSPTVTATAYNSGIACPNAQTGIAVTQYNGVAYAVSQFLPGRIAYSSNGQTWTGGNISINDTVYTFGLGIGVFNGKLYLAYAGSRAGVSVASSTNGTSFTYQGVVSSAPLWQLPSGWLESPAVTTFTYQGITKLYVGYLTTNGFPIIGSSADGTTWTSKEYTTSEFNHDLTLFTYNSALYFAGQSYFSDHNLWMAGAYDGVSFLAATKYGPSMNNSPSATNFNGIMYMVFRSNYGENMWYAYANP